MLADADEKSVNEAASICVAAFLDGLVPGSRSSLHRPSLAGGAEGYGAEALDGGMVSAERTGRSTHVMVRSWLAGSGPVPRYRNMS